MRNFKTNRLFASLVFLLHLFLQVSFGLAQSNATLSLNGSIEPSLSINVSNTGRTNNSDFFANAIPLGKNQVRIELQGVGPVGENTARFSLQLRSNVPYKVEAAIMQTSGNTADSQFGLGNLSASGQRTAPAAVSNSLVANGFAFQNNAASAHLSLLTQSSVILTGPRISNGGGPLATTNALNVDLAFNVKSDPNQAWSIYLELRISAKLEP
jgi:hypothetical protein